MGLHLRTGVAAGVAPWAAWRPSAPYTLGVEEEVMLLDPATLELAQRGDEVLPRLGDGLAGRVSAETHQGAIELATAPHRTVGGAVAELRELRELLAARLHALGIAVAAAGTHPTADRRDTVVSPASRYQLIHRTMRDLARREPTFALHVHVGVPDAAAAMRLLNRLRAHLPLLLALSASSPFWQGRATGIASSRTVIFQAFPRTGIPRRFDDYDDWAGTVDGLLRAEAIPEPTFLWWDVRPQPRFGTVEVRVMDSQPRLRDAASLVALVQAVARLELEEGYASEALVAAQEVLEENRFLAARDGAAAELIDPVGGRRLPVRRLVAELVAAARPHAEALGCAEELEGAARLDAATWQAQVGARDGLPAVVRELTRRF
ncbi:MAG: YbdK family carboxylate-amine ligase [Solirubrobacterales bacterium]|nr:YbdK family carboxylate-amine ligase [Solirubrobacterales bacterium]